MLTTQQNGIRLRLLATSGLLMLTGVLHAPVVLAEASFHEGFDGKTVGQLESEGWLFRNQSVPLGPLGWRPADLTDPFEGTHYLVSDGYCVGYDPHPNPVGSNWAVLPAVAGQSAGETMQFYLAEGWSALRHDVLQLRYSPSGGSSTGSGPEDLGDFTVMLAEYVHDTIDWWSPYTVTLPGDGRVAFRFYTPTGRAASMYVDSITIGAAPDGPVPLPVAGETVHWEASMTPIVLGAGIDIVPAGGVVIVDAGVQVAIESNSMLQVDGTIIFNEGTTIDIEQGSVLQVNNGGTAQLLGSPANRITVHGSPLFNAPGIEVFFDSQLTMQYADLDTFAWVSAGAVAVVDNVAFSRSDTSGQDLAGFRVYHAQLAVRNSSLTNSHILNEEGYLLLDNVELQNSYLSDIRFRSPHTLYLNNITANDNATGAPFRINGFDVLLGPDNVIVNNLYPVRLEGGGLASGSTLPVTGNLNNYVSGIARFGARSTWAQVGVPYVLDWDNNIPAGSGRLTIEPGVVAQFRRGVNTTGDVFPIEFFADLVSRGTPDAPIVFQAHDPVAGWGGLYFGSNSSKRPKLEHTIVEQADTGVIAAINRVRLESAVLRDNGRGAQSNSGGSIIARNSAFRNNDVGVETSPGSGAVGINAGQADLFGVAGANEFANNGVGLIIMNPNITQVDARHNWWGDASGPDHPDNPGGAGDAASQFATVIPFAMEAPEGSPPQVRLMRLSNIQEEGTRVLLRWNIDTDHGIASQRLEYSPHGDNPGFTTLVDNIPHYSRTLEVTIPQSPPSSNTLNPVLRLVALDNNGREGWDEAIFFTPYEDVSVLFTVDTPPPVMHPGQTAPVCWSTPGGTAYLDISDRDYAISLGGTTTECLSGEMKAPALSTDLARIIVVNTIGAGGRARYEYSDYFSIRPDAALGDEPPQVSLLAPLAGELFTGGDIVTVAWIARDDEQLRSIDLQASYDGGRNWNDVATDLPGTSTNFDWQLPSSEGIADVRLRVVARDLRFQASSDGANRSFIIAPGDACANGCEQDLDADGWANSDDNCTLVANTSQADADADGFGNACDPDIAQPGDCIVNALDLMLMRDTFFSQPGNAQWNANADFNDDGRINLLDLEIMKSYFFLMPGPSGIATCAGNTGP